MIGLLRLAVVCAKGDIFIGKEFLALMDLKTYTKDTNMGALMFQAFSVISLQLHAFSGRLLAAGYSRRLFLEWLDILVFCYQVLILVFCYQVQN